MSPFGDLTARTSSPGGGDLKIHEYQAKEILRRYEMVPDREERRIDFGRRCDDLRSVHESLATGARATL